VRLAPDPRFQRREGRADAPPGPGGVALIVAALALSTFVVRIAAPVGTSFYNMQLCYFPSYLAMFALGVGACRRRWLEGGSDRFALTNAAACLAVAALAWWPLLAYGGALERQVDAYAGGLHWQSAAMAGWESLVCVGMAFAVLAGFRAFASAQAPFARFMSRNAFAVYVIHPPLLIAAALAIACLAIPPVQKFVLLWMLAAAVSFGIAAPLARRLPLAGRILQ
jgi:glucans biosynthesis protein C